MEDGTLTCKSVGTSEVAGGCAVIVWTDAGVAVIVDVGAGRFRSAYTRSRSARTWVDWFAF